MLNRDLRLALSYPHQNTRVTAERAEPEAIRYYGIDTAVDCGFINEVRYTIVEVRKTTKFSATAEQVRKALYRFHEDEEVLIFVPGWHGQEYAYFAVDSVRFNVMNHHASIILGDWRYGG